MKDFVSENVNPNATRTSQTFGVYDSENTVIKESYNIIVPNEVLAAHYLDLDNQEQAELLSDPQAKVAAFQQDKALLVVVLPANLIS